uniref:Uncharacterized protein n=1 Tax=Caenorhabditis japonica TaxID=281687 RepID=A0A8R1HP50_CAEJA
MISLFLPEGRNNQQNAADAIRNAQENNAAAGAAGAAQQPQMPPFVPFFGHHFGGFPANLQIPPPPPPPAAPGAAAAGPFPHQIFYTPAPANRPEFANLMVPPALQVGGGPPAMFPMMPPPLPPTGADGAQAPRANANPRYTELSTEELQRLEGDTREAILARLQAMDNILVLLESAQMQMIQIARVTPIQRLGQEQIPVETGGEEVPVVQMDSEIEVTPLPEDRRQEQPTPSSSSSSSEEMPSTSTPPRTSLFGVTSTSSPVTPTTTTSEAPSTSQEIRERRLARLLGETTPR